MSGHTVFYALIEELQVTRNYKLRDIAEKLEIPERTLHRWRSKADDEEIPVTPDLIRRLAQLLRVTTQDVAMRLGYGYLYDETPVQPLISPFPLADWPPKHPDIHRAVESAIEGRNAYGYSGNLRLARLRYEQALDYARAGHEPLLAQYIQLLLGNTLRLLGKVDDAERTLVAAQHEAQETAIRYADKPSFTRQLHTANVLVARAKAFQIVLKSARGDLIHTITEAPTLFENLKAVGDYSFVPYVYYVLGRAHIDLEQPDQALNYAEQGVQAAYLLSIPRYARHTLFLDHPIGYGYEWRVDHLLQLMTDALIAAGDLEGAEETYLSMLLPKSPATSLSLRFWFSELWQEYKAHRQQLWTGREAKDSNIDASFDTWFDELAQGGDLHMQAIIHRQFARTLCTRNQVDHAVMLFQQAMALADQAGASFTAIVSGVDLIHAYAQRQEAGDKSLALSTLDMIKGKVELLSNPFLWERYKQAREVAMGIEER